MLDDLGDKRLAVAGQLGLADAMDAGHFGRRARQFATHVTQRAVAEDHVGREARLPGQLPAQGTQPLVQLRVVGLGLVHAFGPGLPLRRPALQGRHRAVAPQHLVPGGRHLQHTVPLVFLDNQPLGQQIAHQRPPVAAVLVLAHAIGLDPVVAPLADAVGVGPGHHLDDVHRPETLPRADHRRQYFLGVDRRVNLLDRSAADVAPAAILVAQLLAEVTQQLPPPADVVRRVADHRVEFLHGNFSLRRVLDLVDEEANLRNVGPAVEQDATGLVAVAARAADFLVVALDVLRQIGVQHETNIRLVDAHAEGDRRHDHLRLVALEGVLNTSALVGLEPRVVGQGTQALLLEKGGRPLHAVARPPVDNTRLAGPRLDELQDLMVDAALGANLEIEVRPIERSPDHQGRTQLQSGDDVLLHAASRRRRKRRHRHARELLGDLRQGQVIGPEVVTPFADAVGLVDAEQRQPGRLQHLLELLECEPLRGNVKQLRLPATEPPEDLFSAAAVQRTVQVIGRNAVAPRRIDLVLHQRNQRTDHHRRALQQRGRQLVTQRLAAAGRHDRKNVPARENLADDPLLVGTKRVEPEDRMELFRKPAPAAQVAGCRVV